MKVSFLWFGAVFMVAFLFSSSALADLAYWSILVTECDTENGTATIESTCSEGSDCEDYAELYACGGSCGGPVRLDSNITWTEIEIEDDNEEPEVDGGYISGKINFRYKTVLPVSCDELGFSAICNNMADCDEDITTESARDYCGEYGMGSCSCAELSFAAGLEASDCVGLLLGGEPEETKSDSGCTVTPGRANTSIIVIFLALFMVSMLLRRRSR